MDLDWEATMAGGYPALSVAKRMLELSRWSLTNLKLQKLLYIAHMIWLGRTGQPLIREGFEAWDYGPVCPVVYHRAKCFGARRIENVFHSVPDLDDDQVEELLKDVVDKLGDASPGKLVAITHWERGAWAKHYRPGIKGIKIPESDILEEYREWFQRDRKAREKARNA